MITSRNLVRKTLEFDSPPRVPRQLWVLPWAEDHYHDELCAIQSAFPDDIVSAPGYHERIPKTIGEPYNIGTYVDEWGCKFINIQQGVWGEVKEPLVKNWDDLGRIKPPEDRLSINIEKIN